MSHVRADWTYQAATDAIALRQTGMPYSSIAQAIGYFHGITTTADAVRHLCRNAGCPPLQHGARGHNFARPAA